MHRYATTPKHTHARTQLCGHPLSCDWVQMKTCTGAPSGTFRSSLHFKLWRTRTGTPTGRSPSDWLFGSFIFVSLSRWHTTTKLQTRRMHARTRTEGSTGCLYSLYRMGRGQMVRKASNICLSTALFQRQLG